MTKLKVRGLKWKTLKVKGLILHFCLFLNFLFDKEPKRRRFSHLTEKCNWVLAEDYIDKNWNLKDWNDKTES